ncbi:DUF2510 domain-containing protein [Leifsonia sp. NPDC058292]|uniref:DUF2510 domain-containing protein n=1 Tax=Leifsonia sp. NPDC058292 TaxID=3346428 RepID=UPI0036DB053E
MPKTPKTPAGWYANDGVYFWWNGVQFTTIRPPLNNPAAARGWYADNVMPNVEMARWWTGSSWSEATSAPDGHHDVAGKVGEAMISVTVLGAGAK